MNEEFDFSDIPTEDDLESTKAPEEGWYHLGVKEWRLTDKDAKQVTFTVLAGTVEGQEKLSFNEFFNPPSASSKDGGLFAKKRLAKLALATGLIPRSALGKTAVINWDNLQGRQILGQVVHEQSEDKKYINARIHKLEMYHVDEETMQHIPKHPGALAMLPPELRQTKSQQTPPAQPPQQAPPPVTPPQQPPATPPAQTPPPQAPPAQQPPKDPWANL